MKNATKHADTLKSLYKKQVKEHKAPPITPVPAVEALVRGVMSYDVADSRAEDAMKVIQREFVDLNELRVATDLEVQALLGQRYPAIEKRVAMITLALNNIFEREHTLNLERLKEVSKRDARQFLRELPDLHPFADAYVMLYSFDGHAFPIDNEILSFLIEEEIIEEGTSLQDAQKFVEHHLKADECYEFFYALRNSKKKK